LLCLQEVLVKCMTDPSQDAETLLCTVTPTPTDDQAAFVLAVRGLLAHGILQHCLQKRHRVDYGVFRCAVMYGNMLGSQAPFCPHQALHLKSPFHTAALQC
jgi:hypothetical protein